MAETMNNIGMTMFSQGQVKDCIPVFERALTIKKHVYGLDNPTVASAIFTVAGLYHKVGEFDIAKERYLEAREIRFGLFGGRHKDTKLCDEMLAALEKDKLKAQAKESKLKTALRSQIPSTRNAVADTPKKGPESDQPLLLMESSIYEDEKSVPQFDSNRN